MRPCQLRDDATAGVFELELEEPEDPGELDEEPGTDGDDEEVEDDVVAFLMSPTKMDPLMLPPSSSLTRRAWISPSMVQVA